MTAQKSVNLWDLSDLCTPWCVHVVATLRIANHMAAGVEDIAGLASAAGCDPGVLHGIMGHLASKGLFQQAGPGRFTLTEASRDLLDPIAQLSLDLDGIGGRMAHAWGTMLSLARTGQPAYQQVFGLPFFEDLEAHPEIASSFDAMIGPAGHGAPDPIFNLSSGWQAVRTAADIGGGTGAMLAEMLRAHPHLRGILVDQPGTVARSAAIFEQTGVAGRVTQVGQSFFDPLPAGADLYVLRGIINDWPDREAAAILSRCAEAARPGGRVVVLKSVGPDDEPRDISIEMVLLGGKHRTVTEFQALAAQSGLELVATSRQPSGHFVVECRPV